jgi:hypothetical protein
VPEEDEVSLIVHSDYPTCLQVWHLREQRGQHATDSVAEHCVEVVHNQFGMGRARCCSVVHNRLAELEARHSECGSWPFRKVAQDERVWEAILLVPEHEVGVATLLGFLNHLFHLVVFAFVILHVRESRFDLFQEIKDAAFRSPVGSHQDLGCSLSLEVRSEFIDALLAQQLLVVSIPADGLVFDSHALNCFDFAFGTSLFTVFLSDLLLLQPFNLVSASLLHLLEQGDLLSLVFVANVGWRVFLDRLLLRLLLLNGLDFLV